MTLQANALLTVEEGLAYLNAGSSDAAMVEDLINRVSDFCESPGVGANRPFVRTTLANLRLPPQERPQLYLAAWPVDTAEPVELTLNGAVVPVWRSEADGDPSTFSVFVCATDPGTPDHLFRTGGWIGTPPYPIRLTYTGGFPQDAIPGDLKQMAYEILEAFYRAQAKRLTEVQSVSGTATAPSVSFSASLIPMSARRTLDSYRAWT